MNETGHTCLWVTHEEANALMSVLLTAGPTAGVSNDLLEHLLCRLAETQNVLVAEPRRSSPKERVLSGPPPLHTPLCPAGRRS